VRARVCQVLKLVGKDGAVAEGGGARPRHVDRVRRVRDRGRPDQLERRAERGDELALLRRHVVCGDEVAAVALGGAHQGEGDAGAPGRRLDDRPALAQCASRLGLGDNRGRHPVLGAAARIEELSFGEHAAAGRRREGRQLQQRRVADQIERVGGDAVVAPRPAAPTPQQQEGDARETGRGGGRAKIA